MQTTQRATCWSVTINNPTPADEEAINLARQKGWKVEGQLEKGDGGTLHYQLAVKTPQVRFSAVKSQFPRAHIEVARNVAALTQYVVKEDTRQQSLQSSQEMYPSLSVYWELVTTYIDAEYPYLTLNNEPYTLAMLDKATGYLIAKGYHVESIAVNPQVRASWKRFAEFLAQRSRDAYAARQDRQTASVEVPEITLD